MSNWLPLCAGWAHGSGVNCGAISFILNNLVRGSPPHCLHRPPGAQGTERGSHLQSPSSYLEKPELGRAVESRACVRVHLCTPCTCMHTCVHTEVLTPMQILPADPLSSHANCSISYPRRAWPIHWYPGERADSFSGSCQS